MYLFSLVARRFIRIGFCCGLLLWLADPHAASAQTNTAPSITSQPVGGFAGVGEDFVFSVQAAGTTPFAYQWLFNGAGLAGQTNASLLLTNLTAAQAGSYSVTVTNVAGSVTSSNAAFTVQSPTSRRLATGRIAQFGSQVGVPIILRANGRENLVSFSLSYDTNAYSNPLFLTTHTNGVVTLNTTQAGVAGLTLTLPMGETFRPGYRVVGLMRFDLAAGYRPVQGGLAFTTNPVPVVVLNPSSLPLDLSASVQPQHNETSTNAQLNPQSGLFEQKLVISNPSSTVMSNVNIALYGLGTDSRTNPITFYSTQGISVVCPLNDCQVYVTCDCPCDSYDPLWGFCSGYVSCSDQDCSVDITGTINSTAYAQINQLMPGESRTVTAEFYVSDHTTVPTPRYALYLDASPLVRLLPGYATAQVPITATRYVNGTFLVEFPTRSSSVSLTNFYFVQYAATPDGLTTNVQNALPAVPGTGSRVQWIDNGPPKTESSPTNGARFYRVLSSQ